jgi:hypothetical protein
MYNQIFAASALIFLSLAAAPALAQDARGTMPHPALNPSLSLSAPTTNPLQAQMREDYATSLRAQQRDLLQQNPSGLSRDELAIGHELNGYTAPR